MEHPFEPRKLRTNQFVNFNGLVHDVVKGFFEPPAQGRAAWHKACANLCDQVALCCICLFVPPKLASSLGFRSRLLYDARGGS